MYSGDLRKTCCVIPSLLGLTHRVPGHFAFLGRAEWWHSSMVSTEFADPTRQLEDGTGMQLVAQCPWSRHHEANEDISHL